MEKRYRFRIYPNKTQEVQIQQNFNCARFIYNYYLGKRIEKYEAGEGIYSLFEASKDLISLKHAVDHEWLLQADSAALSYALCDLDNAFKKFFKNVRKGDVAPGFPNFKSKKSNHQSYRCKNRQGRQQGHKQSIELDENKVKLPKLSWVKCKVSKQIEGRIISATVLRNPSGKYFVSINCTDYEPPALPKTDKTVGLHMGANNLAVTSDGTVFEKHRYLARSKKKIKKLQQRLSRKTSGSKNYEKARIQHARASEHLTNQKDDTLHKLTTQLVREYDTICVRNELISKMMTHRPFGGYLTEANLGELVRYLTYKCEWYGKTLVKVDEFFPSVQLCSSCGYKNADTKNYRSEWNCPKCGAVHHRAENAAINVHNEGLRTLAV